MAISNENHPNIQALLQVWPYMESYILVEKIYGHSLTSRGGHLKNFLSQEGGNLPKLQHAKVSNSDGGHKEPPNRASLVHSITFLFVCKFP